MSFYREINLNTSLRDAAIFDEEKWGDFLPTEHVKIERNIKIEVDEETNITYPIKEDKSTAVVKIEFDENSTSTTGSQSCNTSSSFKSAKRSLKQRDMPYSKEDHSNEKKKLQKQDKTLKNEFKRTKPDTESDPQVLNRRQKQIDFGKNTIGYDNFISQVPRDKRDKEDPVTPNKYLKYSRRAWDGLIKQWRLRLHKYD